MMKNKYLTAFYSLALASALTIGGHSTNAPSFKQGQVNFSGFSYSQRIRINNSINDLKSKYNIPFNVYFIEDKNLDTSGKYLGFTNRYETIKFEGIENYTSNYLKFINSSYNLNMPFNKDPLENLVIHELGHAFFSNISEENKSNIVNVMIKNDLIPRKDSIGHPGHASYLSYLYMLDEEIVKFSSAQQINDLASEQFSETFLYIIHGFKDKDSDEAFKEKKEAVLSSLLKFKKN